MTREIVERIPDETGDAPEACTVTGRRDPYCQFTGVAAPVQLHRQPSLGPIRHATEVIGKAFYICTVELVQRVDQNRVIASGVLSTDGVGSVSVESFAVGVTETKQPRMRLIESYAR